jgi:hypothetical protein
MATAKKNTAVAPAKNKDTKRPLPTGNQLKPEGDHIPDTIVRHLTVSTVDRTPKDPGVWRSGLISATSVAFPNRSRLYDVYEDLLLDPFLFGLINKRISQVVNKKLLCRKNGQDLPDGDKAIMEKFIRSKVFKDAMRQIIWRKMWGISGLEFIPGDKMSFNLIPRKHIKPETQIIGFTQYDLNNGVPYADLPNVWIIGDQDKDLGLLLVCGFMALLKKGAISDWGQYIEIFGSPAIVLRYKGFDSQAKKAANKILENVANSMRMAIPEEMKLEFIDGKLSNGDGKLHETFRQACNEEMSIAILGNTETTGHSKTGTGAKSETHAKQQMEIIKDDMDDLVDLLNSDKFMAILKSYNLPVDGCEFDFDREVDMTMLADRITIDKTLVTEMGLQVAKSYFYATYAIPEPKAGEDLLEPPTPPAPVTEPGGAPPKKPTGKSKPQHEALSAADITAIVKEQLTAFFDPAL